jgi:hypothetical protein
VPQIAAPASRSLRRIQLDENGVSQALRANSCRMRTRGGLRPQKIAELYARNIWGYAMPVPTEAEWGDCQADLDQSHAHKLFAGRTNQEMLPHFRRNVIERTDELRWMPISPFRYYMLGFRDFVMTGDFDQPDAPDAANCLLGLVLGKLERQPE